MVRLCQGGFIINKFDAAVLIGLFLLLSVSGRSSPLRLPVILACFVFIYFGYLKASGRADKIAKKILDKQSISASDRLPQSTCETEIFTENTSEVPEYCIKRTGLSKSVSPGAAYIGRSPDQTPRRRVPVRSYRGEGPLRSGKFAVIEAETVQVPDEADCGDKEIISDGAEILPDMADTARYEEIRSEDMGKTEDLHEKADTEKTVPVAKERNRKSDQLPSYDSFPEEGYIDPGLPEI